MENKEIGLILRKAREKAGFSRELIADMMGKSPAAIGHWETGHTGVDANTLFALCRIYGIDMNEAFGFANIVPTSSPFSSEASEIAAAYDRADEKSRKMARLALEDFMETPVPAMAKRRTERAASDDSPGMDTWHIRDTYWRETLSQWLKEHPDASISSGDVPEWVEFNLLRAVNMEGLPGWSKEELRERAERLFEHPWTGQANILFPSEMNAEAERRRRGKSAEGFAESSVSKTQHPYCAQCPLVGRCSQRFSEKPFLGLRFRLQFVNEDGKKEPPVLLSDEECPLYYLLKRTAPKSASGEQIVLDKNGKPLLPAGNIDLLTILGMINPAFQSELAKALNTSGDNGDDSEKA